MASSPRSGAARAAAEVRCCNIVFLCVGSTASVRAKAIEAVLREFGTPPQTRPRSSAVSVSAFKVGPFSMHLTFVSLQSSSDFVYFMTDIDDLVAQSSLICILPVVSPSTSLSECAFLLPALEQTLHSLDERQTAPLSNMRAIFRRLASDSDSEIESVYSLLPAAVLMYRSASAEPVAPNSHASGTIMVARLLAEIMETQSYHIADTGGSGTRYAWAGNADSMMGVEDDDSCLSDTHAENQSYTLSYALHTLGSDHTPEALVRHCASFLTQVVSKSSSAGKATSDMAVTLLVMRCFISAYIMRSIPPAECLQKGPRLPDGLVQAMVEFATPYGVLLSRITPEVTYTISTREFEDIQGVLASQEPVPLRLLLDLVHSINSLSPGRSSGQDLSGMCLAAADVASIDTSMKMTIGKCLKTANDSYRTLDFAPERYADNTDSSTMSSRASGTVHTPVRTSSRQFEHTSGPGTPNSHRDSQQGDGRRMVKKPRISALFKKPPVKEE